MNMSPSYLLERMKLKKQVSNWRALFFIALTIVAILAFYDSFKSVKAIGSINTSVIARIDINGIILNDQAQLDFIKEVADNDAVKAVIMHINSPGGTTVGGEVIYRAVRALAGVKPVVIVQEDSAASAAYMISVAGDYIIARNGTMTGSIGIIAQTYEITELAQRLGIKLNTFKSSPVKGIGFPTEAITSEGRKSIQDTIDDQYEMFLEIVSQRRNIPLETLRKIGDGRIYTGRQALKLKLIDAIGDESAAIKWLETNKSIKGLKVKLFELEAKEISFKDMLQSTANVTIMLKNFANSFFLNFK